MAQQEQTIRMLQDKGSLEGTLLAPEGNQPCALVLIIAGSGPTDRQGNNPLGVKAQPYRLLAEALAKQGIASFRYDKRGIAQSFTAGMKEIDMRFEDGVKDAGRFLDTLQTMPRFKHIIIVGHSEGSLVGMLLAQQKKVHGFVSLAGIARSADEVIKDQLKAQTLPDSVNTTIEAYFAQLKQGKTIPKIMQHLVIYSLFRTTVQPYMISWLRYTPQQEIAKVPVPVAILQGDADIQVAVQEAERLHQAVPHAVYQIIPQMNHVLKHGSLDRAETLQNYQNPNLPLATGLLDALVAFVRSVF